jgi:hypothetical protein
MRKSVSLAAILIAAFISDTSNASNQHADDGLTVRKSPLATSSPGTKGAIKAEDIDGKIARSTTALEASRAIKQKLETAFSKLNGPGSNAKRETIATKKRELDAAAKDVAAKEQELQGLVQKKQEAAVSKASKPKKELDAPLKISLDMSELNGGGPGDDGKSNDNGPKNLLLAALPSQPPAPLRMVDASQEPENNAGGQQSPPPVKPSADIKAPSQQQQQELVLLLQQQELLRQQQEQKQKEQQQQQEQQELVQMLKLQEAYRLNAALMTTPAVDILDQKPAPVQHEERPAQPVTPPTGDAPDQQQQQQQASDQQPPQPQQQQQQQQQPQPQQQQQQQQPPVTVAVAAATSSVQNATDETQMLRGISGLMWGGAKLLYSGASTVYEGASTVLAVSAETLGSVADTTIKFGTNQYARSLMTRVERFNRGNCPRFSLGELLARFDRVWFPDLSYEEKMALTCEDLFCKTAPEYFQVFGGIHFFIGRIAAGNVKITLKDQLEEHNLAKGADVSEANETRCNLYYDALLHTDANTTSGKYVASFNQATGSMGTHPYEYLHRLKQLVAGGVNAEFLLDLPSCKHPNHGRHTADKIVLRLFAYDPKTRMVDGEEVKGSGEIIHVSLYGYRETGKVRKDPEYYDADVKAYYDSYRKDKWLEAGK